MVHADLEDAELRSRAACARGSAARPNGCCRRRRRHASRPGATSTRRMASLVPVLPTEPVIGDDLRVACARAPRGPAGAWRRARPARRAAGPAPAKLGRLVLATRPRRRRPSRARRDEIVAVVHLALDGEEEIAGLERARVDRGAGRRREAARRSARRWRLRSRRVSRGARSSLPLRDGRPDLVVVRERQGPVADDLAGFVAFAGDDQHVARRRSSLTAVRIASARSPISRAPGAPARISARIAAGSSRARIVVGDDRRHRPSRSAMRP